MVLSHAATEALGYIGGAILGLCLIPQVYKILKTKSATDISISWSLLYLLGTLFLLAYLILVGAMAAWIPLVFEITCILVMLLLKIYFDKYYRLGQEDDIKSVDAKHQGTACGPEHVVDMASHAP